MHIIAIGWIWVVLMMAITESSVVAGVLTLVFYGVAPCALLLWLGNTTNRRRKQHRQQVEEQRLAQFKNEAADEAADSPDLPPLPQTLKEADGGSRRNIE